MKPETYKRIFFTVLVACFMLHVSSERASAAVLYAGSASENTSAGQSFVTEWYLDTENESVNLLNLELNFSAETLEVVEISKGSVLNLWLKEPAADNEQGYVSMAGGVPGGVQGKRVPLFRITFFAKKTGQADIFMNPSSAALKHDGQGSAAPLSFTSLSFVISPEESYPVQISSPSHPNQNQWSQKNKIIIKFTARPKEVYSYSFSQNLEIFPDNVSDELRDEYVYDNFPDGIYYFRLNVQTASSTWQELGVYRVKIDQTAPEDFIPVITASPDTAGGQQFMSFSTVDKTSGISHYEIETWPFVWKKISSPHLVTKPWLRSKFQLRAYDLAGNYREIKIAIQPIIPPYAWGLIIAGLAVLSILLKKQIWK